MIGYLKGKVVAKGQGSVIVNVGGIGYEVMLPGYVEYCLRDRAVGDDIEMYTLYHHPEKHPTPRIYGFRNQVEREFFEELTRVKGIGPSKATAVFARPVGRMARAIAEGDVDTLKTIKGVSEDLAGKMVAELKKRASKYALLREDREEVAAPTLEDVKTEVLAVLTAQLGHSKAEAQHMIDGALKQNPKIKTAEELFDEVYRGQRVQQKTPN